MKKLNHDIKLINLKLVIESELLSIKTLLVTVNTENWSREIFVIDSVLKTNLWTYKIKDLNGKNIIGSFYKKEL